MEMSAAEKEKPTRELKSFYKKLLSYRNRQLRRANGDVSEAKDRSLNALRLELQREYGRFGYSVSRHAGATVIPHSEDMHVVFSVALDSINMSSNGFTALDIAISIVNTAIGVLESTPISEVEAEEIKTTVEESPLQIFDVMQFHPRIITASKSLFETGHYSQAIFEAFKAVNNFVKEKTGLSLDGKDLMAKVFREEDPIIRLNELKTRSEKDEQEGFMFLFMGAMAGIRNPKAHDNVVQTDPYRALEYLSFASLLMKRVEEGKVVRI